MLAVVVPAHNEAACIVRCVEAIRTAARDPRLHAEPVRVVVVADACTDSTAHEARLAGADVVEVRGRNVGQARAAGAAHAMTHGARWLAFTDADTIVGPRWLASQLALRVDAVCGTVEVADWGIYADTVRHHHDRHYQDRDGHRHIHGANFGVGARAYRRAGGFPPLACHEDVALVAALIRIGARIAWSAAPRVVTSARPSFRAAGGFGETLALVHGAVTAERHVG